MKSITTHVLDTATGRPAKGVPLVLELEEGGAFRELSRGETDDDGRCRTLLAEGALKPGTYRLTFDTKAYLSASGRKGFYPYAQIVFEVEDAGVHHHVPLLLSPYGYSTYRGS